jgi:hypothetical protein
LKCPAGGAKATALQTPSRLPAAWNFAERLDASRSPPLFLEGGGVAALFSTWIELCQNCSRENISFPILPVSGFLWQFKSNHKI